MPSKLGHSVKELTPALRNAAETLLGRSLNDDEIVSVFAFREPQSAPGQPGASEWEKEMEEFIDSFPQSPLLSDEAISRDSIYTREDEMG